MSIERVVITGSTGMLGATLAMAAEGKYELFGLDREPLNLNIKRQIKIDLTDATDVTRVIKEIKPDCIVHCAALTNVDQCEKEPALAQLINARATDNLVRAAEEQTKFIYISTASIFNGEKGDYSENDAPLPLNIYAETKLEGERFVEQRQVNYAIIRTDIIGWNLVRGQSFIEWIFNNLSRGNKISMFTDVIFTPISVNTLSEYIIKIAGNDFCGRLNIGVTEPVSKYELGVKLADSLGLDQSLIVPGSIAECALIAKRPKNTSLNTSQARNMFGRMPTINEEITKLKTMKEVGR